MMKFLILPLVFLTFSCALSTSDNILGLKDNEKYLEYDRRLKIYRNIQSDIDSENYLDTADFINYHVTKVLNTNEKPSFYDNITVENIYSNTIPPYLPKPVISFDAEPGDLIFIFNSENIHQAGFFLQYEIRNGNYYILFITVVNGKVIQSSARCDGNIDTRRILVLMNNF